MRMLVSLACVLAIAACVDDPAPPPARLEPVADLPFGLFGELHAAFDTGGSLVISDGSGSLHRLVGARFRQIPGSQPFGFATFGFDRDRALLVAGAGSTLVVRLPPDDVFVAVGPDVPESCDLPIGTAAGNIYIRNVARTRTYVVPPDGSAWTESPLDLSRAIQAPDGTVFAIVDGDVVRLAADDSVVPVASCTPFGGGTCGNLVLSGFDARGQLYLASPNASSIQILDTNGVIRDVDLPGDLRVHEVRAGAQMTALVLLDMERNERALWIVTPDDRFQRVSTVPGFTNRLLADHDGALYLVDQTMSAIVAN